MISNINSIESRIDALEHSIQETNDAFKQHIQHLKDEVFLLKTQLQIQTQDGVYAKDLEIEKQDISASKAKPSASINTAVDIATDTAANTVKPIPPLTVSKKKTNQDFEFQEATPTIEEAIAGSDSKPLELSYPRVEGLIDINTENPRVATGQLSLFFTHVFKLLFGGLIALAAPLKQVAGKILALYAHYQSQGKAPVFLMTAAGLITLTFGFAYLLQYSFEHLLNDLLKSLFGFMAAVATIALGVWLSVKKSEFQEYAASVIALGVIFSYLMAYFTGPYYGLVSAGFGFALLVVVTLISTLLALTFETRIVAAITLVGGVLMPFVSGNLAAAGWVFLIYLWLLSASHIYISRKIQWPGLAQTSFILSLSGIEYLGISAELSALTALLLISAFFYLYAWFFSFDTWNLKECLSRVDTTLLIANVFYLIYAAIGLGMSGALSGTTVSAALLIHSILLIMFVYRLKILGHIQAPLYLMSIGMLVATAVFMLAPIDVATIIWSMEGLILLALGFHYQQRVIRIEGYAIFLIAMTSLAWHVASVFFNAPIEAIGWAWANLVIFGGLMFSGYRLINQYQTVATEIEHLAGRIKNEIFSLWGGLALLLPMALFAGNHLPALLLLPMLWCFYRAAQHRLKITQIVGFMLFLLQLGWLVGDSLEQPWLILVRLPEILQIGYLGLILVAWGLFVYYKRMGITGRGLKLAMVMHETVFFLPLAITILFAFNIYSLSINNVYDGVFVGAISIGLSVWLDNLIAFALLTIGLLVITRVDTSLKDRPLKGRSRSTHSELLQETASFYASVVFLATIAMVSLEWMFAASIIPLLLLLNRSLKLQLPWTEKLAWGHFLILAGSFIYAWQLNGHLHFTTQPLAIQITWFELLLAGWLMPWIYQRHDQKMTGSALADKLRIGVYLVIPLLFLPKTFRLYPEYFASGLWASFVISWLLYRKLRIPPLLYELTLLYFAAMLATVVISLNAVSGGAELPGLIALVVGSVVLICFHWLEATLSRTSSESRDTNLQQRQRYFALNATTLFYFAFVIAAISYAFALAPAFSLTLSGLFFLYLVNTPRVSVMLRPSFTLVYVLIWISLSNAPVLMFFQQNSSIHVLLASLSSIIGLGYLSHQQLAIVRLFRLRYGELVQLWMFHTLLLGTGLGWLNQWFTPWFVGTSLFMLLHAVLLLFLTLKDRFQGLLRLSIILYVLTTLKVLLHDMQDFSTIYRIVALMAIGSILMLAAYWFQKVRENSLKTVQV